MELTDLVAPGAVAFKLRPANKKQLLQQLAAHAARLSGLDERKVFERLSEREKLGSTGVGGGIAIPHGKLPNLQRLFGVLATLDHPVDFDALDDQPVDLAFCLLAPEGAGADHLKALSRVSRLLRDKAMVAKLRGAQSGDALFALIASAGTSAAA